MYLFTVSAGGAISTRPVRDVNTRLAAWHQSYIDRADSSDRRRNQEPPKLGLSYALSRAFRSQANLHIGYFRDFWLSYPPIEWSGGEQEFEHRSNLIEALFANVTLDAARCAENLSQIIQEQSARHKSAYSRGVLIDQPDPWEGILYAITQELKIRLGLAAPDHEQPSGPVSGPKAPVLPKQTAIVQAYLSTSMQIVSGKSSNPAVRAGLQVFILGMTDMLRQAENLTWDQFTALYQAALSEHDLLPSAPIESLVKNIGILAEKNAHVGKLLRYGAQSIRMYVVERDANAPTDLVSVVVFAEKNASSFTELSSLARN